MKLEVKLKFLLCVYNQVGQRIKPLPLTLLHYTHNTFLDTIIMSNCSL